MHFLAAAALLPRLVLPVAMPDSSTPSKRGPLVIVAVRAAGPVIVDGSLDEDAWRKASVVRGFVQSEPSTGAEASEPTEVRVIYDANMLYIGALLHDREPDKLVVNDIKKDFREEDQDAFEVILDTFRDRRNGYVFLTNVEGARADRQVANEGREINANWDAVWTVKTRRTADGWVAEMAIPFRALRFEPGSGRSWGINFSRRIRRKNEIDFWAPIPREYAITRLSLAGTLEGIDPEGASRDLRVKPYALARSVRATGVDAFTSSGDAGLDVKARVAPGLTLDATLNPDFAQVEADEQQVNLTQFSQFFPEKREFFLENSGVFYVGDAARNNRVQAPPTPDEDLLLFFSRRIGLTRTGTPITIPGGLRLTGNAGGLGIGAMAMRTADMPGAPASTYTTLRLRRNLGDGTDIGVIAMSRDGSGSGDWNRVGGLDANVRFAGKLDWNSFAMMTRTPGRDGGQYSWRTSLNYEGRFLHAKAATLTLGDGFQDDLGFYRRTDVRKWYLDAGLRPRAAWLRTHGIREVHPHITWNYYEGLDGRTLGKNLHSGNTLFFNDGGFVELSVNPRFEYITEPFRLNRADPTAAPIAIGGYAWNEWMLKWTTDLSRPLAVQLTGTTGGLWTGHQRTANATVTVRPGYRFRLSAGMQQSRITLDRPAQAFDVTLLTGRTNYSFTTNMFLDALAQYDPHSHLFNANVRFNVIHHPLSDLFIVYSEQRITAPDSHVVPGRSLVVKFTQMFAL
ncbi:MAG: DUF5916 domain-containing protein [Gemmatimonadaceae bacterium]|jgi:hypothetical protein